MALSLLAVMLVVAAPTMISILDNDVSYDASSKQSCNAPSRKVIGGALVGDNLVTSEIESATCVNDDAGNYILTTNTTDDYQDIAVILDITINDLLGFNGFSATVSTPDVVSVHVKVFGTNHTVRSAGIVEEDGTFSMKFSSLDRALLKAMDGDGDDPGVHVIFEFGEMKNVSAISFTLNTLKSTTVVNATMIMGAVGVLLIMCAILATPFFPSRRRY